MTSYYSIYGIIWCFHATFIYVTRETHKNHVGCGHARGSLGSKSDTSIKDGVEMKCLIRDNKVVSSETISRDERCTDNYSGVAPRGIGSDSRIEFVIEDRV